MAQSARDARLETRSARLKLIIGQRYFRPIGEGASILYRRTGGGYGTFTGKYALGEGKYETQAIGEADDHQEADGVTIFTFYQAQEKLRQFVVDLKRKSGLIVNDATVADAMVHYLEWYRRNRKAIKETEHNINAHILPKLGHFKISSLTPPQLRRWLEELASTPARVRSGRYGQQSFKKGEMTSDEVRARKATANRILTILKAALNKAFQDGLAPDGTAWKKVKPFPKVNEAKIRFLNAAESIRLLNACELDLRFLINAALLTGARFGELANLKVCDVLLRNQQVFIAESKSGKSRYIPLNAEGVQFFEKVIVGKLSDESVFMKVDRSPWGKNHHVRALKKASETAKVIPAVSFHELRHTYASSLAQVGVDLLTISKLLGHADTRITSKHYAHLTDKTLAHAVEKLPSFKLKDQLLSVVTEGAV